MKNREASRALNRIAKLLAVAATLTTLAVLVVAAAAAEGDEKFSYAKIVRGKSLYGTWCVSCHGDEGKGDGPVGPHLRPEPSDLTLLSKKNGGVFPFDSVSAMVDGRKRVPGHGSKDMPVWGDAFHVVDEEGGEEGVKQKINDLVHFVRSIQLDKE